MMSNEDAFIVPDYRQNTVANIPATVAALLKVPIPGIPALRHELWQPILEGGEVKRGGHALLSGDDPSFIQQMVGRHGGMSAAEMDVPWLAFRLDHS